LFVCFFFDFGWQLLVCENTLIQVVKLKRKNSCPRRKPNLARRRQKPVISPLGHERLLSSSKLILTHFFLRDKLPISMKMLVFFLAKCVRNVVKTMAVDRNNQKALALPYLASKPWQKAANSNGVPTEFEQN